MLRNEKLKSHNPALMALYEIIHLNRNFITTLAHYQTQSSNINTGLVPSIMDYTIQGDQKNISVLLWYFVKMTRSVYTSKKRTQGTRKTRA